MALSSIKFRPSFLEYNKIEAGGNFSFKMKNVALQGSTLQKPTNFGENKANVKPEINAIVLFIRDIKTAVELNFDNELYFLSHYREDILVNGL